MAILDPADLDQIAFGFNAAASLVPMLLASYQPHTVEVSCCCRDVEHCTFEKYIADIRILQAENNRLRHRLDAITRLASAS